MITYSVTIPSRRQMLRIYMNSISEFWFFFFRFNCYFSTSDQNTSVTLNVWRSSNSSASGNVKNHVGMCWCVCCNCSNLVSYLFFFLSFNTWLVCEVRRWRLTHNSLNKNLWQNHQSHKEEMAHRYTHTIAMYVECLHTHRMFKSLLFMANPNHFSEQCATNCNRNGIFENKKNTKWSSMRWNCEPNDATVDIKLI